MSECYECGHPAEMHQQPADPARLGILARCSQWCKCEGYVQRVDVVDLLSRDNRSARALVAGRMVRAVSMEQAERLSHDQGWMPDSLCNLAFEPRLYDFTITADDGRRYLVQSAEVSSAHRRTRAGVDLVRWHVEGSTRHHARGV